MNLLRDFLFLDDLLSSSIKFKKIYASLRNKEILNCNS